MAGAPANPEAQIRLEVYQAELARHGIDFDSTLVVGGYFRKEPAAIAIGEMLARGVEIDAIVAANDAMAFGAIEALRKHGRQVPRDVAVTGFDDLQFARLGNPPLTTIRQPFAAMAETAVRLVFDQMQGLSVPLLTELPSELVVRHSCGCNKRAMRGKGVRRSGLNVAEYLQERAGPIREILIDCLGVMSHNCEQIVDKLLEGLRQELAGHEESFVRVVEDIMALIGEDSESSRAMQFALIALRREFSEVATLELEVLWNEAGAALVLAITTGHALRRLALDNAYFRVLGAGEQASAALDLASLESVLLQSLLDIGANSAFISLHPEDVTTELEPFVCLVDRLRADPHVTRFPAHLLLPPGGYPSEKRRTSIVHPLTFEKKRLGVSVLEYSASLTGYNLLRNQLGSALHNVALHQEILNKTMLHERSIQERSATAKRLEALSVLAGGVAHDLNNALGPLVALPDIILSELEDLQLDKYVVEGIRGDIESIKVASLRAAQTIKDLLTLGRQGRVAKEPLDLNRVVQHCLAVGELRFLQGKHHDTKIVVEVGPEPLIIRGSEAQLTRAIINLVHNAIESIKGCGQVIVKSFRSRVLEPTSGYESVEPGDYAVVTVTDDGSGISSAELGRLFEPFFSKKRTSEQSGTGLGLAIVHGVAKEHEGYVDVTSTVGKGTTFVLYFPIEQDTSRFSSKPVLAQPATAKILVVDDELIQLRTASRILTRRGYEVDTIESGRQAFDLMVGYARIGDSPYQLVILDMLLNEEWDGLQVYEQIRQLFPKQKGVVVSGHAPTERVERAVRSGLTWLAKPYTADALARIVGEVLTG